MTAPEHGAGGGGDPLGGARRLVVKIGLALLVDAASGEIRRDWLDGLAEDIAALREAGCEVLFVSSGAVALGRRRLGLSRRNLLLEKKQAAAAAGQIDLAGAYVEALARHGIGAALILISLDDTEAQRRHVNARNTLETLLRLGSVPVINENNTVAAGQTRFGDNDRLAARVDAMTRADTLVLLSDIDGLYAQVTPEIEAMAGKALPGHSTGGMATEEGGAAAWRSPAAASAAPSMPWRGARAARGSPPRAIRARPSNAGSAPRSRWKARWWSMPTPSPSRDPTARNPRAAWPPMARRKRAGSWAATAATSKQCSATVAERR
jgi:uridylate kinase